MDKEGKAFAEWVETSLLAKTVMNGLECSGVKPTAENAKKVWLDFLGTELNEDIFSSIAALKEKYELEEY